MTHVPFWAVVAILVAAIVGTLAAIVVAVVFAVRARNAEARYAKVKEVQDRAMAAAYDTSPGQLFDFSAGLRRQVAVRILTGEDGG
jgi:hypothetical protein